MIERAFLVERYVSPATAAELAESTARTAQLCADQTGLAGTVQYLYSAYLPSEDTCFCLFRAPSAEAVRAVNTQAGFVLDRITNAELLVHARASARH